jgi:hypothetical protein
VTKAYVSEKNSNMSWVMFVYYINLLSNCSTNITPDEFLGFKRPNHFMSSNMICWWCLYAIGKESSTCISLSAISQRRMEKWRYSSAILCLSITILACCRDIAQAVSRRLRTAAARVLAQIKSCGICGGQSGTWARFYPSTSVSLANSHSTNCSTLLIYHPGLVQ